MAKILVVDDDPDVVEATRLCLEKQGYEVACAYSRQEGMAAVSADAPDLVILDVMMEQHDDGFIMAQQLRRQGFRKPILMLTSISKVTGFAYGVDREMVPVDAFQEKPIDPQILLGKIRQLLAAPDGKGGGGSCC
jgi:DNA-binding response OmpR family regulator